MSEGAYFSRDSINREYVRLRHSLGWRLLTCPERNVGTAKVALIALNPGGKSIDRENPNWSQEAGNAYVVERWRGLAPGEAKLQKQVRRLFEIIGVKPNDVLSGYLVPFRSPNWKNLQQKEASLKFGMALWQEIFGQAKPEVVIAFGKDTGRHVASLLTAKHFLEWEIGWGSQTVDAYRFQESSQLIVLPHLSRFGIFHRSPSEEKFGHMLKELGLVGG